ncbi:MAG TPA: protein kinase [Kofleriaceae bacterium]|nr:protein kinase [Kofleriaceae bacterium]
MIGQTVHEFRIEKKLAEGGMGAVYLARHRLMTSTLKVIKVLLPEYARNAILRQRFHREAEAASRLKHEKILGIDNFGTLDDGQLFIMVPYLEGQPLDAYLHSRGGSLSPYRALHLVVQLCDALDYAHAQGIIHRDLKPGNVYVIPTSSNPYMLKLLDFGIAKLIGIPDGEPMTQRGIAIGTPGYMAVEQYERADEVTHLADVYSLAVMTWTIVTGRLPWQHAEPAVLYHLQRTRVPGRPPVDIMPAEWAEVLLEAMSVDPSARPQSARELATRLASALPAVGRLPSGAEILSGLAPHFIRKAAPGDETVRNASDVDRIGPLLWPPRETIPGAPRKIMPDAQYDALFLHVGTSPKAERGAATRAVSPITVEPTGAAPPAGLPTTLSAGTGVTSVVSERRGARWKLALGVIGTAAGGTLITFMIASRLSTSAASSPDMPTPSSAEVHAYGAGASSAAAHSAPITPAPAVSPAMATPEPAPAPAHEPALVIESERAPVPGSVRELAPGQGSGARAQDGRAPRSNVRGTPAVSARLPVRPIVRDSTKPVQNMRSTPDQPRRPAVFDPDDVSGPEE